MPLTDLVRHLNAQSVAVHPGGELPFLAEGACVFGQFAGWRLESHFLPIVETATGKFHGHAASLRVRGAGSDPDLPFGGVFSLASNDEDFVYLDRLIRTLHALNYLTRPVRGNLLLRVHPRHVLGVAGNHGLAFEEILRPCGLVPDQITRSHYEAVVDVKTGFQLGDRLRIRRHEYTVVGQTRRMVSSGGDPMVFIPLKDAQEAQFLKDNDAIQNDRARTAANPALNRPGVPGLLEALQDSQASNHSVNAVLVRVGQGQDPEAVAAPIRRWKHLQVYTRLQMEDILVAKLIATSAKQIGMFLVILSIVSTAIVAFIIYTMTLGKIREIAVLKLIGTRDRTIAGMILQQALGLGLIGFIVGKTVATLWAPVFPKYVLLEPGDALRGFLIVMLICALASTLAIRAALRVDPATAIGG